MNALATAVGLGLGNAGGMPVWEQALRNAFVQPEVVGNLNLAEIHSSMALMDKISKQFRPVCAILDLPIFVRPQQSGAGSETFSLETRRNQQSWLSHPMTPFLRPYAVVMFTIETVTTKTKLLLDGDAKSPTHSETKQFIWFKR